MRPSGTSGSAKPADRRIDRLVTVVGAAAALIAVAGLVSRFPTTRVQPLVQLAAFAPVAMAGALVAFGLFAWRRRRPATIVAGILGVTVIATQLPLFAVNARPDVGATDVLTVLQANLMVGHADPQAVLDLVRRHHVDVLTVEELTQDALDGLVVAGLERELPYEAALPAPAAAGTGVWTRYPMTNVTVLSPSTFHSIVVRTATSTGAPVTVVAAHPRPPIAGRTAVWDAELTQLQLQLAGLAEQRDEPIVVGADLNATWDIAQFRRLLTDGYADAADLVGAGIVRTYPTDRHVLGLTAPPLLSLDHVLVRGAQADHVRTLGLPGSDHRGLLATLRLSTGAGTVRVVP